MEPSYKKMLWRMSEKQKRAPASQAEKWFLYILLCSDGSLYTGITKDLSRRLKMHQQGRASRYTRTRRPVNLRYQETCEGRTQALVRECKVKAYTKKQKERLIAAVSCCA